MMMKDNNGVVISAPALKKEDALCMQSAGFNRRFCGAKRTRCGASGLNL